MINCICTCLLPIPGIPDLSVCSGCGCSIPASDEAVASPEAPATADDASTGSDSTSLSGYIFAGGDTQPPE